MRKLVLFVLPTLLTCLGVPVALFTPPAVAVDLPPGQLVSEAPAPGTPHVLNGRVESVVQVGDMIILGGTFTSARNDDSQTQLARSRLLAFNATTGLISTTFAPDPNGPVNVVLPAGDGTSVYVGGSFDSIGGLARRNLARVRVSDGAVLPFNATAVGGQVRDLRLAGGRLWVAGGFSRIAGQPQGGLATVNPQTGAFDGYMGSAIAGVHNGGSTAVFKIDVTPDGSRLVAIGNFDTIDAARRHQIFMLDLTGASAATADFHTAFYEPACSLNFDSIMHDVDLSPDGSYFVVVTTGAYGGGTGPCDTAARWETDATGTNLEPSWIDYSGGDSYWGVEVTDSAAYVGGHQRWQNNPHAGDSAGPGAVSRTGIAALDPVNGLPFSWNPTRTRGVGVFDFLYTDQGLWVASDTDRIGNFQYRGRIALLPRDGATIPGITTPRLPNDVYLAGAAGQASDPSVLYRVNAGGPTLPSATGIDWAADTDAEQSPFHNRVSNRAGYGTVPTVDATVPAATPRELFSTELWDPGDATEQQWDFPVPEGTPLAVRLYLANRYGGTSQPGQRVFDVDIDGVRVLDQLDLSAAVGHDVGTMREFLLTSDGNVDIDLGHVVENPLVNGIEILRTDVTPPPPTDATLTRRHVAEGEVAPAEDAPLGGLPWNTVRGAFVVNETLYTAWADGTFTRQTFDGEEYGPAVPVDTHDELTPLGEWMGDIQGATGMFYDTGRIYFTRSGSDQLYYRYFTPESDVVGARRYVATGGVDGIDFSQVRGMFHTGEELYWATPEGALRRIDWQQGAAAGTPVAGTAEQVSGPDLDGVSWSARALFLAEGEPPAEPPTAAFTASCEGATCSFDATESSAPGGAIAGYDWSFGDGATRSGRSTSHTYSGEGTYTVALTVTAESGLTDTTTRTVTVDIPNRAPTADFTFDCTGTTCSFDGGGASDPDGTIESYAWDFGDGQTGTGGTVSHDYGTEGTRTVTLTVTDNEGSSASASKEVGSPAAALSFVGAGSTNGNRRVHRVTVPAAVAEGDRLVVFLTVNTDTKAVGAAPAGWALLESGTIAGIQSFAWTKTATSTDAGSVFSVTTDGLAKSDLTVAAYRSSGGSTLATAAGTLTGGGTAHTTPIVEVTDPASWLVSYWAGKSSGTPTWTVPSGQAVRSGSAGTSGGNIAAVLADSDGSVPTGTAGGLTATTSVPVQRAAMFSVVVGVG